MKGTLGKLICAAVAATVLGTGCSQSMADQKSGAMASPPSPSTAGSSTKAAGLRAALNTMMQEHVYLAAAATNAALNGRDAEFKAAGGALDANGVALSKAIGSVYGADAEKAFLPLWR